MSYESKSTTEIGNWRERLLRIADELHNCETPQEYLALLLAYMDEINEIQRDRGLNENFYIRPYWFPSTNMPSLYQLYEIMRNLHLIGLPELCPSPQQLEKWIKYKEVIV